MMSSTQQVEKSPKIRSTPEDVKQIERVLESLQAALRAAAAVQQMTDCVPMRDLRNAQTFAAQAAREASELCGRIDERRYQAYKRQPTKRKDTK